MLNKELKEFGKVRLNIPLAKYSTFKVGGSANFIVEVTEREKLIDLLNFLNGAGENYFILGGGSNILFPDDGFEGVVIAVKTDVLNLAGNTIEVDAGVALGRALSLSIEHSLTGLEWAAGIPGTMGGAVRGNAGAMGSEMAKNISRVEVWVDGEILELSGEECQFAYRESRFKNNGGVILRAWLTLEIGDKKDILLEVKKHLDARRGKFPAFPSAGSFFKNVELKYWVSDTPVLPEIFVQRGKIPAAWLIDQAGLKGYTVGGAQVSPEHGNFIINFNNATQSDVLQVVDEVKTKVYNKFKVELEEEVEIVK